MLPVFDHWTILHMDYSSQAWFWYCHSNTFQWLCYESIPTGSYLTAQNTLCSAPTHFSTALASSHLYEPYSNQIWLPIFFQVDLTHQWTFCPFTQRLCPTNMRFNSNNSTKIGNKGNLIYKIFLDRAIKTCFILPFKLPDIANKNRTVNFEFQSNKE